MLHVDKVLLALLLLRIYLRCGNTEPSTYEQEFNHLLLPSSETNNQEIKSKNATIKALSESQIASFNLLSRIPEFKNSVVALQSMSTQDFSEWILSDKPEANVPSILYEDTGSILTFLFPQQFIL